MSSKDHPWGEPPWKIVFHPQSRPLPDYVDFAVVGGGFTGLSAAAWLSKLAPNRSVLVLESASLGEGASGRTGALALAETAAGKLPRLGDVLGGYKKILHDLKIDAGLQLPGVWELSRSSHNKRSPISWNDSGNLKVVRTVPGGTVDPGKVLAGLARAAQNAGAQIAERAEVRSLHFANPVLLGVRQRLRGRTRHKQIHAGRVLLATNAFSLDLSDLPRAAGARLTLALATAPLTSAQLKAIGLSSRRAFYTVDLPYLWGRALESNVVIFGAGLVPPPDAPYSANFLRSIVGSRSLKRGPLDLYSLDVHKGDGAVGFCTLEARVRNLHPALKSVRITHRWGGPILFTVGMRPIFRHHSKSKQVILLGGYNGHGVALSVYLGKWAAEALLDRRSLPLWS